MPLLNILRVNNMGYSFSITFYFLDSEVKENYNEVIWHIRSLFLPSTWLSVITTNYELALIIAIN